MAPGERPPMRERRSDHALRALYLRVDTTEKLLADIGTQLAILEAGAVTYKWLIATLMGLFVAALVGSFTLINRVNDSQAESEARSAESTKALAKTVEKVIEDQTDIKVWAKATYLVNVEKQPRESAKQEANKEKEK